MQWTTLELAIFVTNDDWSGASQLGLSILLGNGGYLATSSNVAEVPERRHRFETSWRSC